MIRKFLTTPKGVRDILPEAAACRRELESRIHTAFVNFGYKEVVTPTIEHLAVFNKGSELDEKMYKFIDQEGETLALRADMTTPMARVTCTRLKGASLPLRLCYAGSLFRYEEPQAGRQREFYQAGVELIGDDSAEADAEVIALAYYALKVAGVKDFRIDVGHTGYVSGLLAEAGLKESSKEEIRKCLMYKDLVGLEEIVRQNYQVLGADLANSFLQLPKLRGGKEILDLAGTLTKNSTSQAALENIARIFTALKWYGVEEVLTIDFSMIKELTYYTGMIMEGYSREMGYYLFSGGRYNNLLSHFGRDLPATGFAMGVDRVLLVLERQKSATFTTSPTFKFYSPGGWNERRIRWIMQERQDGLRIEIGNEKDPNVEELEEVFVFRSDERVDWYGKGGKREFHLDEAVLFMTVHHLENPE